MSTQLPAGRLTPLLEGVSCEPIKITDVKLTRLTYQPTDGSYVHECGPVVLTKYDVAIVEVFTDQGLVGIGPGAVNGPDDYTHLIGKNPFDVVQLGLPAGFADQPLFKQFNLSPSAARTPLPALTLAF